MKSEKEILGDKLKAIAGKIDQNARMEWALKNRASLSMVNKYFAGEVGNLIIGNKLFNDMLPLSKKKVVA